MPRVSLVDRGRIVGQHENGTPTRIIAGRFNVHKSTVCRIIAKYRATGDVKDLPKSGRPRITTAGEDRHIVTTVAAHREKTGKLRLPWCKIWHFLIAF